jgi:hypothetical protein
VASGGLVGVDGTLVGVDAGSVGASGGLVGVDDALTTLVGPVSAGGPPPSLPGPGVAAFVVGLGVTEGVDVGAGVPGVPAVSVGEAVAVDEGVTVGEGVTVEVGVGVGVGVDSNCATTVAACCILKVQVVGGTPAIAAHEGGTSPLQPTNMEPLSGISVSVTWVLIGTDVEHVLRHCKPAGAMVTEPDPAGGGAATRGAARASGAATDCGAAGDAVF